MPVSYFLSELTDTDKPKDKERPACREAAQRGSGPPPALPATLSQQSAATFLRDEADLATKAKEFSYSCWAGSLQHLFRAGILIPAFELSLLHTLLTRIMHKLCIDFSPELQIYMWELQSVKVNAFEVNPCMRLYQRNPVPVGNTDPVQT